MKTQFNKHNQQGFTLVELLVVIMIITVLATLGFSVGNGALQRARKVTAQSAASNVANAVEQFYSEYHLLPDPTGGATEDNAPFTTTTDDGITLLDILSGFEDEENERGLRFLTLKEVDKGERDGIKYQGSDDNISVQGLYDPWGQPYYIIIDYDYDGNLEFSPSNEYSYNVKLVNKHVAVYSLGTDSPNDAKRKDLVKTW